MTARPKAISEIPIRGGVKVDGQVAGAGVVARHAVRWSVEGAPGTGGRDDVGVLGLNLDRAAAGGRLAEADLHARGIRAGRRVGQRAPREGQRRRERAWRQHEPRDQNSGEGGEQGR